MTHMCITDPELAAEQAVRRCHRMGSTLSWSDYHHLIRCIDDTVGQPDQQMRFLWSCSSQAASRGQVHVPIATAEWMGLQGVPLICLGGIASSARRFDFLGRGLRGQRRVIALDWPGRGLSGWLPEQADYTLENYVDLLAHYISSLGDTQIDLLGSSLGGAVAMTYAARYPARVRRLILNDTGTFIPRERRQRRAAAVGRHYVFRSPSDLFRRLGAAAKDSGPLGDAVLLHHAHHGTIWSEAEQARIYRHDLRALLSYRNEATTDLDLWDVWREVKAPVLILHGLRSDALHPDTLTCMAKVREYSLIEVPDSGHTPALSSSAEIQAIHQWLLSPQTTSSRRSLPIRPDPERRFFIRRDL